MPGTPPRARRPRAAGGASPDGNGTRPAVHQNGAQPGPVFSAEAEMSVLGGGLIDADALRRASRLLREEMFYRQPNRFLWRAMLRLLNRGEPIDPITLSEELKASGDLESVGGMPYVAQLLDAVPSAANIDYHARIVRQRFAERKVIELSAHLAADPGNADLAALLQVHQREAINPGQSRYRFLTLAELDALPPPSFLIDGVLPAAALALLVGPPGCGKSFLALDWALCRASGLPWQDRSVEAGAVAYVAAEGVAGLSPRVRAWKTSRMWVGADPPLYILPAAVPLAEAEESAGLLAALSALPSMPGLVVVDTLARSMEGRDENSAGDMGALVQGCDLIRRETGATVLLIHHTNASGERERGSTALRGAVDVQAQLKPEEGERGSLTLTCEKMKDSAPFERLRLRLRPTGESCVIAATNQWQQSAPGLSENELAALLSLPTSLFPDGVPTTRWSEAAGIKERTFYRVANALIAKGYVQQRKVGNSTLNTPTPKGTAEIAANCQSPAN